MQAGSYFRNIELIYYWYGSLGAIAIKDITEAENYAGEMVRVT